MVGEGAKRAVTPVTPSRPRYCLRKNLVLPILLCTFAENYANDEERDYCTSTVEADQGAGVCQRYPQRGTPDEYSGAGRKDYSCQHLP